MKCIYYFDINFICYLLKHTLYFLLVQVGYNNSLKIFSVKTKNKLANPKSLSLKGGQSNPFKSPGKQAAPPGGLQGGLTSSRSPIPQSQSHNEKGLDSGQCQTDRLNGKIARWLSDGCSWHRDTWKGLASQICGSEVVKDFEGYNQHLELETDWQPM